MPAAVIILRAALIMLLLIGAGIIIHRVVSARYLPVSLCLFLILPAGQLLMLYSFSFDGWSAFWLYGLLLSIAANVLLLFYAVSQEKKTAALEELRETRHMTELEKSHYEAVEQRRKELAEIRSGFGAKLQAAAELARAGGDIAVRESISALAERISGTKEKPYCAVPVINAVLTQKEEECASAGIRLNIELRLPDTLAVEPVHLCSIFGNLLDNAIAACRRLDGADKPVIHLSSIMDGDYLFIKTVNPSGKPAPSPAPGHGYGQRILNDLAKCYDGNFKSSCIGGIYTAVISLTAPGV